MNPRERRILREAVEARQRLQLEVMAVRNPELLTVAVTQVNNLIANAVEELMRGWKDSAPGT